MTSPVKADDFRSGRREAGRIPSGARRWEGYAMRRPSSAQLAEPREIRPRHREPVDWDDRLDVESEALYVAQ
jgi:hypothetical protein